MTKYLLPALSLILASTSWASGPSNLPGHPDRLEAIECFGAHHDTWGHAQQWVLPAIQKACGPIEAADAACVTRIVRAHLPFWKAEKFEGSALRDSTTFKMNVLHSFNSPLKSRRTGSLTVTSDGVRLSFDRLGLTNDSHRIHSGAVSQDAKTIPYLIVPTAIPMTFDQIYFFVDGCELTWTHPTSAPRR